MLYGLQHHLSENEYMELIHNTQTTKYNTVKCHRINNYIIIIINNTNFNIMPISIH